MNKKYIVWYHPGKGSLQSTLEKHVPENGEGNPSLMPVGTVLRNHDMIGVVLPYAPTYNGDPKLPLAKGSILVKCLYSVSPIPDLDLSAPHIWSLKTCQTVTGPLLEYAKKDPKNFLLKFSKVENNVKKVKNVSSVSENQTSS